MHTTRPPAAGETAPCPHPRANHQHGTYLAHDKDGCRCAPCVAASRRHAKLVDYRTRTASHTYVDATKAREHVRRLLTALTIGQIEQRSGVHRTAIRVLIGDFPGRVMTKRITRRTEQALLAVDGKPLGPEHVGLVDSAGTRRRLRALVAIGWPAKQLCDRLGWSSATIARLLLRDDAPVLVSTRAAVCALYDELSMVAPAPSRYVTRARNVAKRRGWAPPLAWDDDTIDDADASPVVAPISDGRRDRVVHVDDVEWLVQAGGTWESIAARLGVTKNGVDRALLRAGRTDLIKRLTQQAVVA